MLLETLCRTPSGCCFFFSFSAVLWLTFLCCVCARFICFQWSTILTWWVLCGSLALDLACAYSSPFHLLSSSSFLFFFSSVLGFVLFGVQMVQAARALFYMMEALPRSTPCVADAIPTFVEKVGCQLSGSCFVGPEQQFYRFWCKFSVIWTIFWTCVLCWRAAFRDGLLACLLISKSIVSVLAYQLCLALKSIVCVLACQRSFAIFDMPSCFFFCCCLLLNSFVPFGVWM